MRWAGRPSGSTGQLEVLCTPPRAMPWIEEWVSVGAEGMEAIILPVQGRAQ